MGVFGTGADRICAVAAAYTAREMAKLVVSAQKQSRVVELRQDWLRNDAERMRFLGWLGKQRGWRGTFLATCRRIEGGGKFEGDVERELFWLGNARNAGCQWCDLEIETFRRLPGRTVAGLGLPPRVMLSLHDFKRTPKLPKKMSLPAGSGVQLMKVAAEARTIVDGARLLELTRRSKNFVATPMGATGLPSRILALREGSALAYAPVAAATAPGQVSLAELKDLYRAHLLTKRSRVYGVIGEPVSHSLSPMLHNTGFIERGIDAVYLPFLVHELRDFVECIGDFELRGFSVTHPHKQGILKYVKECDPLAAEIGAVNTVVVRRDGSLAGSNTDYIGLLSALEEKMTVKGSRFLIYGAGGVARAAALALVRSGGSVVFCARRKAAGKQLARAFGGEVIPRAALRRENFDAVLNATPVGMLPNPELSPLTAGELRCKLVMDLITRPYRTKLLQIAAQKGIATIPGVEMLLAQGYAQWELWTGQPAPKAAIRRAVLAAVRAE